MKWVCEQPICAKCELVKDELLFVKVTQNCILLFDPLTQLNVIESKVFNDALCDSYYDVKVKCKIGLFEEMQEYKPPTNKVLIEFFWVEFR